jgi:hypothetical protein
MTAPRVLLMRLFERTSAKGNRYLTGRLSSAKLIAFEATDVPDEQRYGADIVWNVYVQGDQDGQRQQPPRDLPTRGRGTWQATADLPTGRIEMHRNERRDDPRQEPVEELAARFEPDTEPGF